MASVNKVILVGNLGKDPDVRYSAGGDALATISLATSESWRDKATWEKKEKSEWHRCTFFGRLAEVVGEYLKKGSTVYVEGKLSTRKWTDKSGQDRYTTEVVCERMQMLGGKPEQQQERQQERPAPAKSGFEDMADDIPF